MDMQLYELDSELLSPNEFHAKFTELTGPTSLFKRLEQRESDASILGKENDPADRPLTPIEEAIKEPIFSFSEISRLLQKRLKARSKPVPGLTANQQQALMGVVLSELRSSWSEVRRLAPVPFLTNQQNQEIERLLAIEVITIAEELYFKTLDKAKALNERGVFSSYANNSRLKAQLALEANESFNIVKIHKRLSASMKETPSVTCVSTANGSQCASHRTTLTNLKKPVKKARMTKHIVPPKQTREEKDKKRRDNDIKEIQSQIADISLGKVEKIFGVFNYDQYRRTDTGEEEALVEVCNDVDKSSSCVRKPLSRVERHYQSLPNIMVGESLLEELGVTNEKEFAYRRISVDTLGINLACSEKPTETKEYGSEKARLDGSHIASVDLKRLVAKQESSKEQQFSATEQDDGLPPLLQALSYHSTKKKDVTSYNNNFDDDEGDDENDACSTVASSVACNRDVDDEREMLFAEESKQAIQPSTVSTRMPDKSVVRTSDVRVSSRVNKSDITLKCFPTVYNDLIGEIDNATVKWLDRNLYIGDEIREVYEEIIKTVGTDHLLFDQDPYVEGHAKEANFSAVVHSTTLMTNKPDKVINPSLHRDILPPWSKNSIDKWRNSPMFGELGRQDILNMGAQAIADFPGKASKSYNSWLAWWRSTITTDDYFKYLSTQDNDYLSLTYHLYESDDSVSDDDSDEDHKPNARELEMKRAREKKLAEIRKLKENYNAGFWNANSVLIGGLGKYPDIKDEELGIDVSDEDSSSLQEQNSDEISSEDSSPLSLQDRLDRVWTSLCMPDALRLDMAIKYSSETYIETLEEVLLQWEAAVKLILSRENLITKLEDFERLASDPNRFFEKGNTGSASARIKEAKTRRQFHHNLDKIDRRVKKSVSIIQEAYGDVVTFQGRPYLEKMTNDRTEMLYWLQQERRQNAFDKIKNTVELKIHEIPPLPLHHVL